jgi:protein-L-isoaspartate(D-aspartate) O-methyltransferase
MPEYETARRNMIDRQLRPHRVTDARALAAFTRIRRELFVPEPLRAIAYSDEDLPLGRGRYLMAPMVAARLIQAAAPQPTEAALVVGAGSGYEAAVLAALARSVVALEPDPALARAGRAALVEHAIAAVNVVEGPLREGHRPGAPYDVILFAGAVAEVPAEIAAQLAEAGRLLAVVRPGEAVGRATLMSRTGGVLARRTLFDAATPLLPGLAPEPAFAF